MINCSILTMIQVYFLVCIALFFQQSIHFTEGVTCASNPCNLVSGLYDGTTGYCCYDVPPYYTDFVCACPNSAQTFLNRACAPVTPNQGVCTKNCVNGGVCNIVNNQQVCWCQLGFSGANCEIQGIQNRCYAGFCQVGTCYEQTIGATTYAYCQCTPGYRGIQCNQCYFTCTSQGIFPDTAQCAIGKYFYCQNPTGAPITASCPAGQNFNRFTNQCDSTYQCT